MKYPAIVAWSPYGKEGGAGTQVLDMFPFRVGVPLSILSEYQKWEGPDPAFWVNHGYAVVNPDIRGAYKSGGDIRMWGTQEGRDGSDFIDWVGEQDWCSGKVTLSGNSWLAVCQWVIAAEKPKHLTCIAPWEGFTDVYGEFLHRGGVVEPAVLEFFTSIIAGNAGEGSWENGVAMGLEHRYGDYHEDHAAKVEDIDVPAYVTASYSNQVHTLGTFSGFARLKTSKWLRIHDTWEWPDYYQQQEDLLRFFDYHMKEIQNGWQETPTVRAKIIETAEFVPAGRDFTSTAFPAPSTAYRKIYFTGDGKLAESVEQSAQLTSPLKDGKLEFEYSFADSCTLFGPVKGAFIVSLDGVHDADIFVSLEKILASGAVGAQLKLPLSDTELASVHATMSDQPGAMDAFIYKGPWGYNRVSNRKLREDRLESGVTVARLDVSEPVAKGQLVTLHPGISPIGMVFSKGEKLRVRISGAREALMPPFPGSLTLENVPEYNATGEFTVHTGETEEGSSYLVLPFLSK